MSVEEQHTKNAKSVRVCKSFRLQMSICVYVLVVALLLLCLLLLLRLLLFVLVHALTLMKRFLFCSSFSSDYLNNYYEWRVDCNTYTYAPTFDDIIFAFKRFCGLPLGIYVCSVVVIFSILLHFSCIYVRFVLFCFKTII